jgi:replicative DNA helicase
VSDSSNPIILDLSTITPSPQKATAPRGYETMTDTTNIPSDDAPMPSLHDERRSLIVTMRDLCETLLDDLYHGDPPVEYQVAAEPWGSLAFRPGEIMALAAPPGMGKTAFIMQAAVNALRLNANTRCLVVNVEMTPKRLIQRQLARLSGVHLSDITNHRNLLGHQHNLQRAVATMQDIGDRMCFMPESFQIEAIVDAMVQDARPDILVIDYLQRIECCEDTPDTRARLNMLMQRFRTIANAGVCVVLVSAVGRTASKRGGGYNARELGLASMRESSEIEYGCDDVFVMVPEQQDDEQQRAGDAIRCVRLKHEKSRNNSQQDLRFAFDGATQSFTLLPPRDDAYAEQGGDGAPRVAHGRGSQTRPDVGASANGGPQVPLLPGDTYAERLLDSDD